MYAENSPAATEEKPFLLAALRVQKCWAELTLHCKALQSMGVENVAYASFPNPRLIDEPNSSLNTAQ